MDALVQNPSPIAEMTLPRTAWPHPPLAQLPMSWSSSQMKLLKILLVDGSRFFLQPTIIVSQAAFSVIGLKLTKKRALTNSVKANIIWISWSSVLGGHWSCTMGLTILKATSLEQIQFTQLSQWTLKWDRHHCHLFHNSHCLPFYPRTSYGIPFRYQRRFLMCRIHCRRIPSKHLSRQTTCEDSSAKKITFIEYEYFLDFATYSAFIKKRWGPTLQTLTSNMSTSTTRPITNFHFRCKQKLNFSVKLLFLNHNSA